MDEMASADFHAIDWRMVDGSRGIQCTRMGGTSQLNLMRMTDTDARFPVLL